MIINISDKAQEEFKKLFKSKKVENHPIRVYVRGYGWGGPVVGVALDERQETDVKFEKNDLTIIMDKSLEDKISLINIDYSSVWYKKGFSVMTDLTGQC